MTPEQKGLLRKSANVTRAVAGDKLGADYADAIEAALAEVGRVERVRKLLEGYCDVADIRDAVTPEDPQ